MKHLKLFESYNDIKSICDKYGIENWTINHDGLVDVDDSVNLSDKNLTKLPVKFGKVTGHFYCFNNKLTTLEGAPKEVGGHFYCSDNNLTTLEGAPGSVGGDFNCRNNNLTTLEGAPQSVGGDFTCSLNKLTTLEGAPQSVGGDFYFRNNQIRDFIGFPEFFENSVYLTNNPISEIYNLFKNVKCIYWINEFGVIQNGKEIIEDRLIEVFHQLKIEPPKEFKFKNYNVI